MSSFPGEHGALSLPTLPGRSAHKQDLGHEASLANEHPARERARAGAGAREGQVEGEGEGEGEGDGEMAVHERPAVTSPVFPALNTAMKSNTEMPRRNAEKPGDGGKKRSKTSFSRKSSEESSGSPSAPLNRSQTQAASSPFTLLAKPKGIVLVKRIFVMVNGNDQVPKRSVTLDSRLAPTLERFMDQLSEILRPEFGAIARVHRTSGEQITDIAEFEENGIYVVCGTKKFKHLNYESVVSYKSREKNAVPPDYLPKQKKADPHAPKVQTYLQNVSDASINVLVVVNGDSSGKATKVTFSKRDFKGFPRLLDFITGKMTTQISLAITRLYTLAGQEITELDQIVDLKHGGVYVAVDRPPLRLPHVRVGEDGKLVPKKGSKVLPTIKPYQDRVAELTLELLEDEFIAEIIAEHLEAMDLNLKRLRQGLSEHANKLQGINITHAHDDLIPNLVKYGLNRGERWETDEEDALSRFERALSDATEGKLQHWETEPTAFAALVILLDQFPRRMFADTPRAFMYDSYAQDVTLRGFAEGYGQFENMDVALKHFPLLALSHQEEIELHVHCVQQWEKLVKPFLPESEFTRALSVYFHDNLYTIKKFGRFPERNAVLGRESTPQEQAHLGKQVKRSLSKKSSIFRRASKGSATGLFTSEGLTAIQAAM